MSALTPVEVENKLRELVTSMTQAQKDLAKARDTETAAEIAYKKARLIASTSDDCPRVRSGGATVSDRDAWVDKQVFSAWETYRWATVTRENAADLLRRTYAVAETVRSLGASVRTAYSLAGTA